MPKGKASLAAT